MSGNTKAHSLLPIVWGPDPRAPAMSCRSLNRQRAPRSETPDERPWQRALVCRDRVRRNVRGRLLEMAAIHETPRLAVALPDLSDRLGGEQPRLQGTARLKQTAQRLAARSRRTDVSRKRLRKPIRTPARLFLTTTLCRFPKKQIASPEL